jgi:CRP/FNR family transcriptional regulator
MKLPSYFAENFEPEILQQIEENSKIVSVNTGDVILDIGETVRSIPIVLKGTVKVTRTDENGRELLLYYINPNESCAVTFTCCMQQFPSEIKATAEDEVEMLAIPIGVMDEWFCYAHHSQPL